MPRAKRATQTVEPQRVETLGDRVAQARRRLGVTAKTDISPAALARMLGKSASTVTRIEKGETEPTEALVQMLASALRVSPAWLRYGEGGQFEAAPVASADIPPAEIKTLAHGKPDQLHKKKGGTG